MKYCQTVKNIHFVAQNFDVLEEFKQKFMLEFLYALFHITSTNYKSK